MRCETIVNEGEAQTFTVTLSGPVSMDVVVGYATANGSATAADYSGSASGTVTIPAGVTDGTIIVPTTEDVLAEDSETFTVTLSGSDLPANVTLGHGELPKRRSRTTIRWRQGCSVRTTWPRVRRRPTR